MGNPGSQLLAGNGFTNAHGLDFEEICAYIETIPEHTLFRSSILLTALTLFTGLAFASGPLKDGSLSAESDGSSIIIRWVSEDETGVLSFDIERKAGLAGEFSLLAPVTPKGSNSSYEYDDDSAFRVGAESIYEYRLKMRMSDGSALYSPAITVVHAVSSVRRTWGSIKAMFR